MTGAGSTSTVGAAPRSVRVDSWLWSVRVYKTRSLASAACRAGHVQLNDERVKPSTPVHVGDTVRARAGDTERILEARRLVVKRVSAAVAAECVVDRTPPPPPKVERPITVLRDRGAGRPTKRDRRDIERLRGR